MSGLLHIFAVYALVSLFFKWLLSWGGAAKIQGWKALFLISAQAYDWSEEQIKAYALLAWIVWTVFCVLVILAEAV